MMNEQQKEKIFVFNDSVLFDFILLVFFLFIAIGSFEYNPRARAIPAGLGILGSAMMLLQFLSNAFPRIGTKLKFVSQSGLLGDDSGPAIGEARDDPGLICARDLAASGELEFPHVARARVGESRQRRVVGVHLGDHQGLLRGRTRRLAEA